MPMAKRLPSVVNPRALNERTHHAVKTIILEKDNDIVTQNQAELPTRLGLKYRPLFDKLSRAKECSWGRQIKSSKYTSASLF